jgi:hypothetical protein
MVLALAACGSSPSGSAAPSLTAAQSAYCASHPATVTFAMIAELKLPLPSNLALPDFWNGQTVAQVEASGTTEARIREAIFLHGNIAPGWQQVDPIGYAAGCVRAQADASASPK